MEEPNERAFLCGREGIRHPRRLGRIRWVDLVLSSVFGGIE
jgi:hypothetical protein